MEDSMRTQLFKGSLTAGLAILLLLSLAGMTAWAEEGVVSGVGIELIAEGLDSPVALADPNDGTGRLFIADQVGIIYVLAGDGTLLEEPFLDISDKLPPRREVGLEERGLLGFGLHPNFAENGWFYVHYSAELREEATDDWDHTRYVSEFKVSADDENRANPNSERVLIALDWPTHKHNGGGLAFGPDGYLYIGFGDGIHGIGDRPDYVNRDELADPERWWPVWHHWNHLAQDLTTLFGKVLRIDVNHGFPEYAVPEDNPFVGERWRDEIYAWGFRQPYRISFDRAGEYYMFVSTTAEYFWESVTHVDGPGNYGYPIKEGTVCYDPQAQEEVECPEEGPRGEELRDAVIQYANLRLPEEGVGSANVGGYLYQGGALPELEGRFVFGDWSEGFRPPAGQVFAAAPQEEGELWPFERILQIEAYILSIGQDAAGELYLLTNQVIGLGEQTGAVYRLVPEGALGGLE
jgi:glucose/arabinose dehydrogenase